jgi:phage tail-like protein
MDYPFGSFNFFVTLDPADAYLPPAQAQHIPIVAAGAFQEVRGLGATLEVTAYAEGGVNDFVHQLPLRHTWSRITLKRGLVRDGGLFAWYRAGLAQSLGARRDGSVVMTSSSGEPVMAWQFRAGIAAKWTGPDLNAMQGAVAIESIEIAHEGLEQRVFGELA